MLIFQVIVDLGSMAMEGYSSFPISSRPSDGFMSYPGLQRCSRCILQPRPTGFSIYKAKNTGHTVTINNSLIMFSLVQVE